jgi:competence protein ComEC
MNKRVVIFWSIFVAAALIRFIFSLHQEVPDIGMCLKQAVQGAGIVIQEPERKETGQVFVVRVETLFLAAIAPEISSASPGDKDRVKNSCGSDLHIRIKTKLYPRFTYGDHIEFTGKISAPFNFKSESGRSFDYRGYLAKDEIFYEIKSAVVVPFKVLGKIEMNVDGTNSNSSDSREADRHFHFSLPAILFWFKRQFVSHLEYALAEPHSALAAGLVVGEKSALGKQLIDDFRIVGLIHIVVLSGFNITIVADALRKLLSFLPRVWGISIGGIGIALFGVMVGGGATVVRSCFMAGIALSADLIRRDYQVMRALLFAGLIMLIQNPNILLHDPSFQLSFLATLGLIMLASPIEKKLGFITERFGIRGIVASTLATQVFVSPYILYMMGSISIIGMVVNILVLPIIPLTMLIVFLTGAAGFIWGPLAIFFGWFAHILLSYELLIVEFFAKVPLASVSVRVFSFWWVVGFYVVIIILFVGISKMKKKKPDLVSRAT